jgi:hypothetical protein
VDVAVALFASVAVTLKLKLPAAVVVPLNTPAGESESPVGNAPDVTVKAYGVVPPDAINVVLYAVPTTELAIVAGVIAMVTATKFRVIEAARLGSMLFRQVASVETPSAESAVVLITNVELTAGEVDSTSKVANS